MTSVWMVDPSAFTPPYDHALCSALAAQGADVTLLSSEFPYDRVAAPRGYRRENLFYRRAVGEAGSGTRRLTKLAQHGPDMLRLRRRIGRGTGVVHFQWLAVPALDRHLLPPGPRVLTAHDLLPREPRRGQERAHRALLQQMDAVITHSAYGRAQLVERLGLPAGRVHVVPHGAFAHLTQMEDEVPLPAELRRVDAPVVLFFGLLRPYKGLSVLLEAWRGITDAELWIVGRSMMALEPLRAAAPPGVRFVERFVSDRELPAFFRRATAVVLPYTRTERFDWSGVLATALAFAKPTLVSAVGGLGELAGIGAAEAVPPDDAPALHAGLARLLGDAGVRRRLAAGARTAAAGPYSWEQAARQTLALYRQLT